MIDPISLITTSIQQDMQRLNLIAHNSANALTAGFKREFLATANQNGSGISPDTSLGLSLPSIPASQVMTDNRAGVARQTGNPLDIALSGDGYFEVRTDTGVAYTRQGTFRLDDRGYLVTQAGFPVAGAAGDILLTSLTPTIDRQGRVFEQGKQVAQIKVVSFESPVALSNIGGGLMVPIDRANPQVVSRPVMVQGKLEASNVDSTQEMVRMMETFRHFETSHRVLQAYDDIHDKAIRNLGQF